MMYNGVHVARLRKAERFMPSRSMWEWNLSTFSVCGSHHKIQGEADTKIDGARQAEEAFDKVLAHLAAGGDGFYPGGR